LHHTSGEPAGRRERDARPVGVEARGDLADLVALGRHDREVARLAQVALLPVERHHVRGGVVDDERLLVRQLERRAAVLHGDAGRGERVPRRDVVLLCRSAARD
jgi:hypothetical protein